MIKKMIIHIGAGIAGVMVSQAIIEKYDKSRLKREEVTKRINSKKENELTEEQVQEELSKELGTLV